MLVIQALGSAYDACTYQYKNMLFPLEVFTDSTSPMIQIIEGAIR